ncbi:uncharacterized protein K02A2.6-like [Nematostella vectensis]|uniref:uncharacterized protein K02A2.6-like n=1 Tax=Nematostella vectensis TaxID=45351 RepID=UPI0013904B08|nr:uncharacterized protein K02A2.6-like [Nematostella vectensis]
MQQLWGRRTFCKVEILQSWRVEISCCAWTRITEESADKDSGVTHLFSVDEEIRQLRETPMCQAIVGGKSFSFIIDSGAAANIVSSKLYEEIKSNVSLKKISKKLYAFGQEDALKLKGEFEAEVSICSRKYVATFYVFDGNASVSNLISHNTAKKLQLLHVNSVSEQEQQCNTSLGSEMKSKFPECFSGVGKLKGNKVKLHIDDKVEPVAQPVRRLPFGYRDKVADLLKRLQEEDIIEPVEGVASRWVSPIVVIPKEKVEIRMCIDLRKFNQAVLRERYPIPTMQEMLVELNGATVFSKLDLKQGFFQLELEEESRDVTTFITYVGLFRMQRLGMGICGAPEVFQYTVQKVLVGLPGVLNLADDIMVFGKDQAEHKKRLTNVMKRLSESGLTLNPEKCRFGLSSITFLGHVISDKGIAADPGKVESIVKARAPVNVTELRRFLGLVQYVGRPGESNIADPMSRLSCRGNVEIPVGDDTREYISMIVQEAVPEAMSWQEIKASSDECEVVQVVKEAFRTGR